MSEELSMESLLKRIELCEQAINQLTQSSIKHGKNINNCAAQILMNDKNIWKHLNAQGKSVPTGHDSGDEDPKAWDKQ